MPLMCLLRSVAAGLLALLLVTGAGCSKTAKKPEAAQPEAAAPPASLPQASTLPTSSAEPPKTLFPSSPSPHAGEGPGVKAAGFESDSKPPAVAPQAAAPQPPREMTAPPSFSRSKRAVAPELPTLSQLPAAEFQHLPAAPPSDPLPKPAPETIGRLDASSAPEPSAAGNARPGEMQNPLRGAEQARYALRRPWARRRRSRLLLPSRRLRLRWPHRHRRLRRRSRLLHPHRPRLFRRRRRPPRRCHPLPLRLRRRRPSARLPSRLRQLPSRLPAGRRRKRTAASLSNRSR